LTAVNSEATSLYEVREMKKASRFFMGIFLCLTIVMLCVGCQGGGDGEGSTGSNGHTTISAASRYTTTSAASADADITPYASFKDDTYYYYMFYLGYVEDVPLQTDYAYYRYSGNSYTHSFTSTSTTSQSVEESCAYTASKTATWDNKIEVKVGHKAEFKAKFFKIAEAKHETSVQVGYSHNWGGIGHQILDRYIYKSGSVFDKLFRYNRVRI
jgi:hypothetical protein